MSFEAFNTFICTISFKSCTQRIVACITTVYTIKTWFTIYIMNIIENKERKQDNKKKRDKKTKRQTQYEPTTFHWVRIWTWISFVQPRVLNRYYVNNCVCHVLQLIIAILRCVYLYNNIVLSMLYAEIYPKDRRHNARTGRGVHYAF
jgi:hypothetical protein